MWSSCGSQHNNCKNRNSFFTIANFRILHFYILIAASLVVAAAIPSPNFDQSPGSVGAQNTKNNPLNPFNIVPVVASPIVFTAPAAGQVLYAGNKMRGHFELSGSSQRDQVFVVELFRKSRLWMFGERLVHKEQVSADGYFDLSSIDIIDGWYRLRLYDSAEYGKRRRSKPITISQQFRILRVGNIFGSPVARFERTIDSASPGDAHIALWFSQLQNGQERRTIQVRLDLLDAQTGRPTGLSQSFQLQPTENTIKTSFAIPADHLPSGYLFEVSIKRPWYHSLWRWGRAMMRNVYFRSPVYLTEQHLPSLCKPNAGQCLGSLKEFGSSSGVGSTLDESTVRVNRQKHRTTASLVAQVKTHSSSRRRLTKPEQQLSVELINAVGAGNLSSVESLLRSGAPPHFRRGAPLIKAIQLGRVKMVEAMSEYLDCLLIDPFQLISLAAENNQVETVLLLANKCVQSLSLEFGMLQHVVLNDVVSLRQNLLASADRDHPLSRKLIESLVFLSITQNNVETLVFLIGGQNDSEIEDILSIDSRIVDAALQLAIRIDRPEGVIELLLNNNSGDPNMPERIMRSLKTAVKSDRPLIVRLLIERSRPIDDDEQQLQQQLHLSDPYSDDSSSTSSEKIGSEGNYQETKSEFNLIFDRKKQKARHDFWLLICQSAYLEAIKQKNPELVSLLFKLNYPLSDPEQAVRQAVADNSVDTLALLADNGVDVHFNNEWAMIESASLGFSGVLAYLVEQQNANIHARDDEALFSACKGDHAVSVRDLLEYGASLQSGNYRTLRHAIDKDDIQMISVLLAKAKPIQINMAKKLAKEMERDGVLKYLDNFSRSNNARSRLRSELVE